MSSESLYAMAWHSLGHILHFGSPTINLNKTIYFILQCCTPPWNSCAELCAYCRSKGFFLLQILQLTRSLLYHVLRITERDTESYCAWHRIILCVTQHRPGHILHFGSSTLNPDTWLSVAFPDFSPPWFFLVTWSNYHSPFWQRKN